MTWLGRVRFYFFAQTAHEDTKVRGIGGVRRPPYGLEQLQVRQDPIWIGAKMNHQTVLQRRQMQGVKILDRALADKEQRENQRQRQQHPQRDAGEVGPGIADAGRTVTGEPANPRIRTTTTTMPVAADRKFCTVSASICVR